MHDRLASASLVAIDPFQYSAQPKSRTATAPNALQNGTSLLGCRPECSSPAALVPDSKGLHTATKIFRPYPQSGLTAPNGGIRSASSIGTVVRSSAAVVGQRSERGVP